VEVATVHLATVHLATVEVAAVDVATVYLAIVGLVTMAVATGSRGSTASAPNKCSAAVKKLLWVSWMNSKKL